MLQVQTFKNFPVDSNCYVIYLATSNQCIIVDPGFEDASVLIGFLDSNGLEPSFIFLTHEHFDHVWGVKHLIQQFSVKVFCSKDCSAAITDPKKNLSVFYSQNAFTLNQADRLFLKQHERVEWNGMNLNFYHTPGHTKGSMCMSIENFLFSGDTILGNLKTITKLPGGSKLALKESIDYLFTEIKKEYNIMPGHGEPFLLESFSLSTIL